MVIGALTMKLFGKKDPDPRQTVQFSLGDDKYTYVGDGTGKGGTLTFPDGDKLKGTIDDDRISAGQALLDFGRDVFERN